MAAYLTTTFGLIVILTVVTVVDIRRMVIPDAANIALLVLGLVAQIHVLGADAWWAVTGALVLGGLFWGVRHLHHRATGRIGLGMGDVKMAGAAGAWIGLSAIPSFLLFSSASALLAALSLRLLRRGTVNDRIAFGPFLSLGLAASWFAETLPAGALSS